MIRFELSRRSGSEDRVVVQKRVDDIDDFQHQVRWLVRARGSGAASLDRVDSSTRTYATRFGGRHTLATWGRTPLAAFPVVDRVNHVLTDLHRLGLHHGAVCLDHVVVGRGGSVLISPARVEGTTDSEPETIDLVQFGRMISELAHLWRFSGAGSADVVTQWLTVGEEVANCTAIERARLAKLIGSLQPGKQTHRLRRRRLRQ